MTALRTVPAPDGGTYLTANGVVQSHLHPDPTRLTIPYVRALADHLERLTHKPLRVLHLGTGLATLARYVQATQPNAQQTAVDSHPRLPRLLRRTAPLPPSIELITDTAQNAATYLTSTFHAIVIDLFDGPHQIHLPADLTTHLLTPDGVRLVHGYTDSTGHTITTEGK